MKSSKRNLLIAFGISLFLLVISAAASFISIQKLLESSRLVNHTNAVIADLDGVISLLKDAETGQRGYLITGEDSFLEPYNGALSKVGNRLNDLKTLTSGNDEQQQDVEHLRDIAAKLMSRLQTVIDSKKINGVFNTEQMRTGKSYMDQARALVQKMQDRENRWLSIHTATHNRFSGFTPVLLVVACVLSLLVTIVFFFRLSNDFKKRALLQRQLEQRDAAINRRIEIIQRLATRISAGDYSIRVTDDQKDNLGSLSVSLNKMAESLEQSFHLLSVKEWLQTGVAGLNEKMMGEKNMRELCNDIISFVATYTNSQAGAIYLFRENALHFTSGYAFIPASEKRVLQPGEGIAGQCLQKGDEILLKDIAPDAITIDYSGGNIRPSQIMAVPLLHEGDIKGVIELATIYAYNEKERSFLQTVSHHAGIALSTTENRRRLRELLAETETQAEELKIKHDELENINVELEAQAEKLQVSEEELKLQQEELVQSNEELGERARLLEEKNQLIAERNKEIQAKAEQLEAATRYKSEFLANMSHELRTPLNSILLLSRLLAENNEKNLSATETEYANVIHSSGRGLLVLIDEILDLSRIEAGKMETEYTQVSTASLLNNMRLLFEPVARDKNLQFSVNADKTAPALIETDVLRLEQVLRNLLSNALKFTAEGAVTLLASGKPGQAVFTVTDTGIGIAADKQSLIFEAFQQADGSTRRKYGGTGLGLSISRDLVKMLGGQISLTSEPGKGSTFIVTVPAAQGAAIEQAPLPSQEKTAEQRPAPEEKYTADVIPPAVPDDRGDIHANDKAILIIEDDTAFAKSLTTFTRKKGYKAIVAVQGDEGIALARRFIPAGILLDIQLPVKNGWEVMEELKGDPKTRHIPVHIMSSFEVKKKSRMLGAVDVINKPVAFEQLQEVFDKIEHILQQPSGKVLIVEDNEKHAQALAWFLESYHVNATITSNVSSGIEALRKEGIDCVIIDIGNADRVAYDTLENVKRTPGLENLPVIIFTGRNLSRAEELRIKKYADFIIVKTAQSYQRILDEVSLFLHLVENQQPASRTNHFKTLGMLKDVLAGKTILVVDDDVRNIFSLTRALESYKVKVLTAVDGKEALKQLSDHPGIDLVIMDMMMPEMDGYEATRQIRKSPLFKELPVLAVTAKAMTGDREKCISAGASDYITKPVDIDQLLSLLRVWLYNKH